MTAVVDASVVLKLFWPEPDSEAAWALFAGETQYAAPDLIVVEVAGALTKKCWASAAGPSECLDAVQRWRNAVAAPLLALEPASIDVDQAASLSVKLRHPIADCIYLAQAIRLGLPLFTADKRFFDRARVRDADVRLLGT